MSEMSSSIPAETLYDRGPTVFVVTLVTLVFATLFTALRVVSKWVVVKRPTVDDYFTVLAWLFAVALSVSIMVGTTVGLGKPDVDIPPKWDEPLKKCLYAFTVFYNPALMSTKTALLVLYYRMAAAHGFLRYASVAVMIVVDLAGTVLTFLGLFQCNPVSAAYTSQEGTCIDVVALYLASAPINILTDLAILLLPLPILTALRMEFRQKVVLVATFIVGGFVTIVDVVRIAYLQTALKEERELDPNASITASSRPPNFTFEASFSLMWSAIEVNVGLMCCCVLVLKPLVMKIIPQLLRRNATVAQTAPDTRARRSTSSSKDFRGLDVLVTPQTEQLETLPAVVSTPESMNISEFLGSPRSNQLCAIPENGCLETTTDEDGDDDGGGMDFFQMLASDPPETPGASTVPASTPMGEFAPPKRSLLRRATILSFRRSTIVEPVQEPTQKFFDFVNMKGQTPLTQLSAKEAWTPIMFVNVLFFLWGFAYGLLGTLNGQIQALLGYSESQTIALHNAYWCAYFIGPAAIGYWVLTREGFRATFMVGLAIYATGAMSFWPSSVLKSYGGFFVSNFIIACGLACLEVAANPFIALAGPGELSEARLNFAQGIQGVGSIISPILAEKALFSGLDEEDLFRVQWTYLAIALFVVFLAVVFYYAPLSEATDDDLEQMCEQRLYNADLELKERFFGMDCRKFLLGSGVILMVNYVGAQESVSYEWGPLIAMTKPGADAFWAQAIYHGLFAASRFIASGLAYFGVPPRIFLGMFIIGAFLFSLLSMVLPPGNGAYACLLMLTFCEGPIFPTLFAMVLRGQGKHTKFASTLVTMAISGGALWPSVVYGVDELHPTRPRIGTVVTVALYATAILWPVALSSTPTIRRWVDPIWSRRRVVGVTERGASITGNWTEQDLNFRDKVTVSHHEERRKSEVSSSDMGLQMDGEKKRPDSYTLT